MQLVFSLFPLATIEFYWTCDGTLHVALILLSPIVNQNDNK